MTGAHSRVCLESPVSLATFLEFNYEMMFLGYFTVVVFALASRPPPGSS